MKKIIVSIMILSLTFMTLMPSVNVNAAEPSNGDSLSAKEFLIYYWRTSLNSDSSKCIYHLSFGSDFTYTDIYVLLPKGLNKSNFTYNLYNNGQRTQNGYKDNNAISLGFASEFNVPWTFISRDYGSNYVVGTSIVSSSRSAFLTYLDGTYTLTDDKAKLLFDVAYVMPESDYQITEVVETNDNLLVKVKKGVSSAIDWVGRALGLIVSSDLGVSVEVTPTLVIDNDDNTVTYTYTKQDINNAFALSLPVNSTYTVNKYAFNYSDNDKWKVEYNPNDNTVTHKENDIEVAYNNYSVDNSTTNYTFVTNNIEEPTTSGDIDDEDETDGDWNIWEDTENVIDSAMRDSGGFVQYLSEFAKMFFGSKIGGLLGVCIVCCFALRIIRR